MATQDITRAAALRIRKELEDRSLTQEWLASNTGIPMRTMSRRLHKSNPSPLPLDELAVIADALQVPLVSLIPKAATRAA